MDCPQANLAGGKFRWITKPFKRWAFAKGEQYTRDHSVKYARKYIIKFLRWIRKRSEKSKHGRTAHSATAAIIASIDQTQLITEVVGNIVQVKLKDKPPVEELRVVLTDAVTRALPPEVAHDNRASPGEGGEQDLHLAEKGILGLRESYTPADQLVFVHVCVEYLLGLSEAIDKNIGLDHSKVREYWLSRGEFLD